MKVAIKIHFFFQALTVIACLVLASCDDKIEDEPDAGDGGCVEECDDTDWD